MFPALCSYSKAVNALVSKTRIVGSNPTGSTMAPSEVFSKKWTTVNANNTVSSCGSNYDEFTPTGESRSGISYATGYDTYNIDFHKDIAYENAEKIYKTMLLEEMRWGWRNDHKEFKSNSKVRANIQLRNVCADGRGWAC